LFPELNRENTHPGVVNTFKSIIVDGSDKNNTLELATPILGNELNAHHLTVTYNLISKSLQATSAAVFNQSQFNTI